MGKRILIVQNDAVENLGLYPPFLQESGAEVETLHAYQTDTPLFPNPSTYDAFVIGPTPNPANDAEKVPYLREELAFLREVVDAGKPVLGVCCGAQILSRVLGGTVVKSPAKEIGGYTVELTLRGERDPLFSGFPRRFPVFHWHSDMFNTPPRSVLLARGEPCPNQAFRCGKTYGVIFHLEIGSSEAARWADAYPQELGDVAKTRERVLAECRSVEPEMSRLARLLARNFLRLA